MIFLLLTLSPLNHKMDSTLLNGLQGRVPGSISRGFTDQTIKDAEGANLEQANPDETLRQKDPVPDDTLESSFCDSETIPTVKI